MPLLDDPCVLPMLPRFPTNASPHPSNTIYLRNLLKHHRRQKLDLFLISLTSLSWTTFGCTSRLWFSTSLTTPVVTDCAKAQGPPPC
jgi:hypothetical protein